MDCIRRLVRVAAFVATAVCMGTAAVGAAPPRVVGTSLPREASGIWVVDQNGLAEATFLFSEPVTVPPGSVRAWRPSGVELTGFSSELLPDQRTVRVSFGTILLSEIVTVILEPTIASLSGEAIDGEISDPSRPVLPSGDGTAGGAAVFRIRVLQGDVNRDGLVDGTDGQMLLGGLGTCLGDPGFVPGADLNRDDCVNVLDVQIYSTAIAGSSLPPLEGDAPTALSLLPDPAAPLSSPTTSIEIGFSTPLRPETVFPGAMTVVRQNGTIVLPSAASLLDPSTLRFDLPSPLPACGQYQLQLSNAIASSGGRLLLAPPALSISGLQAPPPPTIDGHDSLVAGETVTLSGTVSPLANLVRAVTGAGMVQASVSGGAWTLSVPLTGNQINTVFVMARSPCGTFSNATTTQVSSDAQPPAVSILFPSNNSVVTEAAMPVSGIVGDLLSGAAKLSVSVNGVSAIVDPGIGSNGTFEARMVPLRMGENVLTATATDLAGNTATATTTVIRADLPKTVATLQAISGDGQGGMVGSRLSQPLEVLVLRGDGSPWSNKLVSFTVTRSDGALAASKGESPPPGTLLAQVLTDGTGVARAWWALGSNAGIGNNRVEATSQGVVGTAFFAASALPAPASRLVINDGDNQRAGTGATLPLPLKVRVLDGVNPVGGVPVTFSVAAGDGSIDGEAEATVVSGIDGIAQVSWTLGEQAGPQRLSVDFAGNRDSAAVFTAAAIASQSASPTTFEGFVLDTAGRAISGAVCTIRLNGTFRPAVLSDSNGRFRFEGLAAGAAEIYINGGAATSVGGESVPAGTFPAIHFEDLAVVAGAANTLWRPVRLPRLDPVNHRSYSTTEETVLTVDGIEGLRFTIAPGSMRLPDGTPAPNGTPVSLNQVNFDQVPMPLPDGNPTPFAWTFQPAAATFDPPVRIEFPNMTGMAPGTVAFFVAWNDATARFDIVGSGRVRDDGATAVSDPGSGITISGWGALLPPPPPGTCPSGSCQPSVNGCGNEAWYGPVLNWLGNCFELIVDTLALPPFESPPPAAEGFRWLNLAPSPTSLNLWQLRRQVCFTEECNGHDRCWGACHSSPSICTSTRQSCDQGFLAGMQAKCDQALPADIYPFSNASCRQRAALYFQAVSGQLFSSTGIADSAYEGAQAEACECCDIECTSDGAPVQLGCDCEGNYVEVGGGVAGGDGGDVLDSDGDGIPDPWEIQYGLDPYDPFDALTDFDGDGLLNIAEFIQEFDPNDPDTLGNGLGDLDNSLSIQPPANPALGQGWTVDFAGRVAEVSDLGIFSFPSLQASNRPARARATGSIDGEQWHAISQFVALEVGQPVQFGEFAFSQTPEPFPLQLMAAPAGIIVLPVRSSTVIEVSGAMSDGVTRSLQNMKVGTVFETTNGAIASVDPVGVVTGVAPGIAFITISNEGTTTVKRIEVVAESTVTTFAGAVELEDGTPVAGAVVVTPFGGTASTAADGSYQLAISLPSDQGSVTLSAVATIDGATFTGSRSVSGIVPGGITDAGTIVVAPQDSCSGEFAWLPQFQTPGTNGTVRALTVFDDGTGPALYAGGSFFTAGGVSAFRIAKWDGTAWSPLGSGMSGGLFPAVYALTVFDDGTGPALYAGGVFTTAGGVSANRIAKWDGTTWSPLGSGMGGAVLALTVFDDGAGPALYAGGSFTTAGGVSVNRIARWDGTSWSPLGSGMGGAVHALTVFDDGTGPALYAGGEFTIAGGVVGTSRIAKWDGDLWSPLGSGMDDDVLALTVFDDGTGSALYSGGSFSTAGDFKADRIAKWDGSEWSPLGSGMDNDVLALTVFDDGTGPALHAGGSFFTAGGVDAGRIAKWNGAAWSPVGSGMDNDVLALTDFDGGTGPALYAGGAFPTAGGVAANRIARWDGATWSSLGSGMGNGVASLIVFDDGTGPALYAGGFFVTAGGVSTNRIAKWDGTAWRPLGSGMSGGVVPGIYALAVFDDGTGPALYAGGSFFVAGGVNADRIAKWDGTTWSSLGSGVNNDVLALTVFDDGTGPALYAGGVFTTAGGVPASRIARWDGTAWSSLGSGTGGTVYALTIFDDGTGPALYAGGNFTTAGGVEANRIARWDGTAWNSLGSGVNNDVLALTVFDDGTGPALYAGGVFQTAGDRAASLIARWEGTVWSPLGSGVGDGGAPAVYALTVFNDGTGPALYVGGGFLAAGGLSANRIARWDGTAWSPLGSGVNFTSVSTLTVFDDGTGSALYAGGGFTAAGGVSSDRIAKWGCAPATAPATALPPQGPKRPSRPMLATAGTADGGGGGARVLRDGEMLRLDGDARFDAIVAMAGSTLRLEPGVHLQVGSIEFEVGATLDWLGGTIELVGGRWTHPVPIEVGCGDSATLLLRGGEVRAPAIVVCGLGELVGEGVLCCEVASAGVVEPLEGGLEILGRYRQFEGGRLVAWVPREVGSGSPPAWPRTPLRVAGEADLAGELLPLWFDPQSGAWIEPGPASGLPCNLALGVVEADSLQGTLGVMEVAWCDPAWRVQADGRRLTMHLPAAPACPDLDGDGVVGPGDLALLLGVWGACPPGCCVGDLSPSGGDGIVDAADLGELLRRLGEEVRR